ncbi:probable LRR receptor-like serine/threonine-protein kinase At3g47570 [Zingiber officinale]|uniref:probable LRR receptor-like serine/threonine-protein kinase At3g47570 n=1 Tax=Zingiber officinale TaxID=94328 RepID=UPI001C4DCE8B|nr:probable LRR receptor-like serine/threonine-protein kinase At3g47570 [Zingiber officinale]
MANSTYKPTGAMPCLYGEIPPFTRANGGAWHLAGKLSPSLAGLAFLNDLDLSSNAFYGPIPRELKNLSNLNYLDLRSNVLQGDIPRDLGSSLSRLHAIPASIGSLGSLTILFLFSNNLTGSIIPKSLGLLHNLDALILRNNKLEAKNAAEWLFLDGLTNCTRLRVLILENNYLGGALPKSVANLSKFLVTLSLSDNYITGCIPAEIGRLVNLSRVDMSSSLLGGAIPASLGNLVKLVEIDLSRNLLAGEIPGSVGNITGLTSLILASNKLNGSVDWSSAQRDSLNFFSLHNSQCFTQLAKGPLPPEIGYLINLQTVDVSYNQLTSGIPATIVQSTILSGNVPDFLGSFNMTYLNLSFNDLQGKLPKHGIFSNLIAFSVVGNKDLCGGIPELGLAPCPIEKKHLHSKLVVAILISGGILCIIFLISFFVAHHKQRRSSSFNSDIKGSYRKVSFAELHAATDGFTPANLVGKGSFGSVYKGLVDWEENKEVAVKVFNLKQKGALRSFTTECEALRSIRHRNAVKVLTACSSVDFQGNDFKALVFEFIPNGSLGKWLHPEVDEQSALRMLSFSQRLNISIDIANVLEYLHFHDPTPVVHCGLKPANVLLDHNMVAHIGDFGLTRFHSATAETRAETFTSSLILKGTIGYAAPEYGLTNKVSVQGDVYSYGILLLEMFSGKKPIDEAFAEGLNLHKYVELALPEQVVKIMDPMLLLEWKGETHRIDSSTKEFRMKAIERVTSVLKSWRFVFNGVARRANEDGRCGQRASHHQGCISWVLFGMTDSKNVPITKVGFPGDSFFY